MISIKNKKLRDIKYKHKKTNGIGWEIGRSLSWIHYNLTFDVHKIFVEHLIGFAQIHRKIMPG